MSKSKSTDLDWIESRVWQFRPRVAEPSRFPLWCSQLTKSQRNVLWFLCLLQPGETTSMNELARELNYTVGTIRIAIYRLESFGLAQVESPGRIIAAGGAQ